MLCDCCNTVATGHFIYYVCDRVITRIYNNIYTVATHHGNLGLVNVATSDATLWERRGLQFKVVLQHEFDLNSRKCCIKTTALPDSVTSAGAFKSTCSC